MSEIDWESGEITAPEGATTESADWESGKITPPVADKGFLGHAKDLGLSGVKSAIAVPETAVGLGDIITGGKTGQAAERLGFRPKDAKSFVSEFHTDKYKEQQQDFQNADGVIDKLGVAVENPSLIANAVTESIAPMLAGGVAGRAVKAVAPASSSVAAASIGEGAVMAGSQAEAIRQETDDGLLTPGQTLAAAGTGALGSVFGYAGGRLAAKLGIGDADTLLTRGITPEQVAADLASAPAKSIPRKVIEGAITEGFLEELPQSVSEQIIQNLALDKPWSDGVDDAIVMGTLSGMAMGGAVAPFGGPSQQPEAAPLAGAAPQPGAIPPEAPTQEPAPQAAGPLPPLSPTAEILPTTAPPPVAPSPSQQMGIDPNAGPMSSAAALAVDSGASEQLAQQSALQQAAELAQKGGNASGNGSVDPDTGEVLQGESQPDRAAQLQERIDYVQKQAKVYGWDQRLMEERESALSELAALQPQEKAVEAASQVLAAGGNEADASRAATDSLIGDMEKSPGISIASDAPAAVAAAVEKAKQPAPAVDAQDPRSGLEPPTSVQEGIKQAQAKAKAKAAADAGQAAAPITAPAERSDGSTETVGDSGLVIVHGSGNPALTVDDVEIVRANGQKQGKKGRLYGGLYGTEEADAAQAEDYAKASGGEGGVFDVSIKPGTRVLNKTGDVTRLSKDYIDELVSQGYGVVKGTDPRGRTEVVVIDKNAIASLGKRAAKAPSSAQEGIEQVRTEKAVDIKAITAKQIPDMTDAELQLAADHYGPDHKRTAKLSKEIARRGVATQNPQLEIQADAQQATETEQASPQRAQAPGAPAEAAAEAAAGANGEVDGRASTELDTAIRNGTFDGPAGLTSLRENSAKRVIELEAKAASASVDTQKAADAALERERKNLSAIEQDIAKYSQVQPASSAKADFSKLTSEGRAKVVADAAARWMRSTETERAGYVERINAKPVLKANLPRADFDSLHSGLQRDIAEQMGLIPSAQAEAPAAESGKEDAITANHKKAVEQKRRLTPPTREQVAEAESIGLVDADKYRTIGALEDGMGMQRKRNSQSIEGKDIDGNWSEFSKESGTKGVPRAEMPQIKAEHRGAMVNFLNARGIAHQEDTVPATSLKPTQAEFSREKVAKAKAYEGGNRSILVSADGHVLDGHHQWMAARENGEGVKVIRLDAPIKDLLTAAREFPSSTVDSSSDATKIAESPMAKYNAVAEQYGYTVAEDGAVALASGKDTGTRISEKRGRMLVTGKDGNLLHSGPDAASFGRFAEAYWFAEKKKPKTEAPKPDVVVAPEQKPESTSVAVAPEQEAAPISETAAKDADRFAGNTLFTADKVAAARARMKSKFGTLNSGIDPEMMIDGMTVAGAYIESGIRDFATYAKAMIEDMGDGVKPYLLSFWEGARNYPGLDTKGMTGTVTSANLHAELNAPAIQSAKSGDMDRQAAKQAGLAQAELISSWKAKPSAQAKVLAAIADSLTNSLPVSEQSGIAALADEIYREVLSTPGATAAVGVVTEKPGARTKKTGAKGDMSLTQDWGVPHIDGYGDGDREVGNDTKDAFLKEARNYLNATADALRAFGYEPHLDRKGKAEKPVSVNEAGPAVSGDVSMVMRNPDNDSAVYITIGGTSLRGMVPTTDSGVSIMYRVGTGADRYAAKAGNSWAPVDLSATDLAKLINSRVRPAQTEARNEQPATSNEDQGRAPAVRAGGRDPQQDPAQADPRDVAARQPADARTPAKAEGAGGSGLRQSGADVAADAGVPGRRDGDDGRQGTSRAGAPDAGAGSAGAAGSGRPSVPAAAPLVSPAGQSLQAADFHLDNPLDVVGGTPVVRFNRNRAALELMQVLEAEGRQANAAEQKVLAGYIGWGSFGQELFQGSWERPLYRDEGIWKARGEWLRETLGESAWKSAQRSITNAHYTDPPTVMAMWDMVRRMGFSGGKVLEPSMGTGNFYSMMPADLKARSQLTGIELDEATGAIAKQLFPKSNVRVMGYQDSKTPDGFYDLVIGNWPFENTPVADRRYNKLNPMLHDYFFLKAMDQVRPGGIVIGITSAGSMDKQNTLIRRELAKQGELVASVRLPSGAFQEYAGTKVVTDIVILRKRPERLERVPEDATWTEVGEYKTPSGETIKVNRYYLDNPQNVIGILDFGRGTTTFQAGMIVHRPENMAERLSQAVSLAPENAMQARGNSEHLLTYYANSAGERHGALFVSGDELMIAMGDQMVKASDVAQFVVKDAKVTAARTAELKAVVALGRQHLALVDAERGNTDADAPRQALNAGYKAFVKAHGPLRESFGLTYLSRINDPFYAPLAALENDDGKPAAVLTRSTTRSKRTLTNPSVRDAYVLARNEAVNPSIKRIAEISSKPEDEVRKELLDLGAVFELPNGDIAPSDLYLAGNVREKLREAQSALDEGNKAMSANVAALKEVQPEDVPYFNIETKLGATWVSNDAYKGFIAHMLSRESTDGIEVNFQSSRWKVRLEKGLNSAAEASTNYGNKEVTFSRLVQAAMSNQTLRLMSKDMSGKEYYDAARSEIANASISKMREDFSAWLWSDPERRQDHEREYNEARNAWATPTYDGSFMTFEGMALTLGDGEFNLRQHQVNAIWRAIVNRRSINAHEVGTGKTFTMGGIAVESRRYGIAKKPLILAHNANSASVAAEIQMMYPSARVLYIDNLDPKNRATRLHQIANDDWDAIVMPHSLIDRLALREDTLMAMAADDIAALEAEFYDAAAEDGVNVDKVDLDDPKSFEKVRSVTAKELAKSRKRIIETIKKQGQQASKEGAVSFEDLGIDMVMVDEAHEFKKPPIITRMQMKGLNTQVSGRSIALQFLTRYVRQENNGGNVHTFTGTPITNTITEIYHQMKYVMESEMEAAGVADWDGWFGSFATEVQDVELTAAGDYEMVTRLAGFVNVPELRQMIGQYMDTVFAEDMPEMQPRKINGKQMGDPELTAQELDTLINGRTEGAQDRPYKKVINASADMTVDQQRVFSELQGYAKDWRDAEKKQRKEWMSDGDPRSPIVTEGIANKASFDVRLLDDGNAGLEGQTNDDPNSKASRVVANVIEIYNSHEKAGQVIFADMGMNKSVKRSRGKGDEKQSYTVRVLSTMSDIVERLVQGGIPRDQIAIVNASTSKEKRRATAEAMNAGTIRVVLGSTDTLGVGVNMQRNLRAMHHLDAPYMPGELEQRNGRGQRQGNQWNTVLEFRYMTDRLDGRRWQILAVKQRFITAFMKANSNTRTIEGEAAADEQSDILESFSEAAGDPRVLQRVKIKKKIDGFQRKERLHAQGIAEMRRTERRANERAILLESSLEAVKKAGTAEKIAALLESQRDTFSVIIDGKQYDNRADATEAFKLFVDENVRKGDKNVKVGTYGGYPLTSSMNLWGDPANTTITIDRGVFEGKGFAGAEARMRNYPKQIAEAVEERATALVTAENMRKAMKQPFSQAADLERAKKQFADLEHDLAVNPVPPPAWLRQGTPVDSEVFRGKQVFVVTGHRYTDDGWFVAAEDAKGATLIPYLEALDGSGMAVYDAREFVAPDVISKADDGLTEADRVPGSLLFSFAGKNAQGADLLSLTTAQERIAAGWGTDSVRMDTGWSRGADGKWRFEISDDQARLAAKGDTAQAVLNNARLNAVEAGRSELVASDVLDHPQLFAAYPELASVPITVTPVGVTAQARLRYVKGKPHIMVKGTMPASRLPSSLLHELQHAIQRKEGYATGGSKDSLMSDLDPTGVNTYRRLAGEVEARNTQARQRMTPAMRREIDPQESADTAADQVIITFNGRDMTDLAAPKNAGRPALSEKALVRAFNLQFPKLAPAVSKMLARGKKGEKGGVVILSDADPLAIAGAFSRKTGRPLSESVQMFGDAGKVNGFYDPRSGLTFLVGPNLDPVTGPAVLLHEMTHGQQKQKIDQRAADMLMNRGKVKNADLRTFLDRVANRMIDAGETANAQEAAAYIVEQAVIEGRSQGYALADSRFLGWVDSALGKQVGDFLRSVLANVRQFMLRNGMPIGEVTVDDLVQYAMVGVEQAANGNVNGGELAFSRDSQINSPAFKRWFGDSKVVDADGKPLVVYHGTDSEFYTFVPSKSGTYGPGVYFADGESDAADAYGANVVAAYISLNNPWEVDADPESDAAYREDHDHPSIDSVLELPNGRSILDKAKKAGSEHFGEELKAELRALGHDGVIATYPDGSKEFVVFSPEQIKSATGNNGDFDPSNPDIRFSRSGVRDLANKATTEFNKTFSAPGKLSAWHKTVGTMYNLAERSPEFKPVFKHAQGFIDDVAHYAADASEHAPTLLPRLETWKDITKSAIKAEDNKAIAKPIFEGTLLWARDENGKAVLVDTLANAASMLSTERKAEILLAQGKVPEGILKAWRGTGEARFKQMIDSRYETHMLKPGVIWSDAELTSLFNLTAPQIAMYREFREATDRSLDTMTRAQMIRLAGKDAKEIREAVMDAPDAREGAKIIRNHLGQLASLNPDRETQLLAMAQSVQQALEQMQKVQGEGYAPLMRFGKFTVYVQSPSGESVYFGMFETAREANAMAASMRELYPNDIVSQGTKGEDMFKMFAGVNPETAELFGKFMDLDSTGDDARDKAFQEWLRITKNNRSAMKRLIHRKGISGYNEDVGRVLASFVYSNSRNTSAGLNMGDLSEAVAAIPKEQGELQDVAVALAEYIKNPQEEAQAVRGLLFAQYLGGSVASAFVNMTQPFAVSFPWLSQYGGAGKAAKALGLAAKHMSTRGYKYEADLAEALKKAEDDGIVSPQEVHQLMAQARGSGSLRAGDGTRIGDARALASNSVARMSVAWGKLFGSAEQVNRRITYIAAYRMAKAQGMASADEFARHAVKETQFVYSKASKMKWGRGAVGGTLMTFKTYSIAYVELMHRLWNQGEPGSAERADGRKAAALMIATLLLMGGAGGLPFAEDLEDLIDGAGQLMGYNLSSKKVKEQFLMDVFGESLGGFIDKGVTGIPGSPVDVSGRLGMGNLIPGTGLFLDRPDNSRDIMELAGPAGDFAKRIFTGGKELLKGNVGKAALEVSPTAVRNAAKGVDMAVTGMYRDTKGYKVLDATLLESALKGVGFQPGGVAKIQEANYLNQRSKAFYSQQAQNIRAQWAAGIFEGDPGKVQAARDALAAWNSKNPEQRIIIRIPDVMRRVREMSLSKDERIAKTAPKAMRAQMMEDAARIRGQLAD